MSVLDEVTLEVIRSKYIEEDSFDVVENPKLDSNSTDIEILDWIIVFLCSRLKSVNLAYKGGYVLMKVFPDTARLSHDIDFSLGEGEIYESIVIPALKDMGELLIQNKCIDSYTIKDSITPTSSGGIKLHRVTKDKVDLGVDIGWHELSYGVQAWDILGVSTTRFSVERMLSDKLLAIFSRKRFRRTKDLYDVHLLVNSCSINIDALREFLDNRGINWELSPFRDDVIEEYGNAYKKLDVKNYTGASIKKPDFSICMESLAELVRKVRGL